MSTIAIAGRQPVLADRIFSRSLVTDAVLVVAGTALTAAMAQLVIPLWPVPITGQTFAVLFVGSTLGALRGALSMALYLVLGVAGLPIFAAGDSGGLIGTTSGGFILGFIAAAALTGWLAERAWDRKVLRTFVSFAAGTLVIYSFGLPWLAVVLETFPSDLMMQYFGTTDVLWATISGGILPFLIGDTIKALLAAALLPLAWMGMRRLDARKSADAATSESTD